MLEDQDLREQRSERKYRGHDPIQALWSQSSTFHTAWFKHGESLDVLQRFGYTVLSLLFLGFGLGLSRYAVQFAREGDFMIVIFGPVSLGFLAVGVLGLKNMLRFNGDATRK